MRIVVASRCLPEGGDAPSLAETIKLSVMIARQKGSASKASARSARKGDARVGGAAAKRATADKRRWSVCKRCGRGSRAQGPHDQVQQRGEGEEGEATCSLTPTGIRVSYNCTVYGIVPAHVQYIPLSLGRPWLCQLSL